MTAAVSADQAQALPDLFGGLYRRHFELAVERSRVTQDTRASARSTSRSGSATSSATPSGPASSAPPTSGPPSTPSSRRPTSSSPGGGRLIKSVGDAVLFSTPTPGTAAAIALDLTDFVATHPALTSLRSGLASGEGAEPRRRPLRLGGASPGASRAMEIDPGTVVSTGRSKGSPRARSASPSSMAWGRRTRLRHHRRR